MDSLTLDTTELRLNWAIDGVAEGITELMDHLADKKDIEGLEAFKKLVGAMNNYILVMGEVIKTAPSIKENHE